MVAPSKKKPPVKAPNPVGRPLKYTEEWLKEEAENLLKWIEEDKGLFLGDFAFQQGYSRYRLTEFCTKSNVFSNAYEVAKQWQERKFMLNGLTRTWDPGFTSLCMARVCDPVWKKSWDREEEKTEGPTTVIINKIEK